MGRRTLAFPISLPWRGSLSSRPRARPQRRLPTRWATRGTGLFSPGLGGSPLPGLLHPESLLGLWPINGAPSGSPSTFLFPRFSLYAMGGWFLAHRTVKRYAKRHVQSTQHSAWGTHGRSGHSGRFSRPLFPMIGLSSDELGTRSVTLSRGVSFAPPLAISRTLEPSMGPGASASPQGHSRDRGGHRSRTGLSE